jgi:hypothetical protein
MTMPAPQPTPTPYSGVPAPTGAQSAPTPNPQPGPAPHTMDIATVAVTFAETQVGKPYRWGAMGPDSYDCSGLVVAAYAQAGMSGLPRTTYLMLASSRFTKVKAYDLSVLQVGDLIFPDAGHVVMYAGNTKCVEAPHTGANVRVRGITRTDCWQVRRVVGATKQVSLPSDWGHWLHTIGNLGLDVVDPLHIGRSAGSALNAAQELVKVFTEYARVTAWLMNPHNWFRLALMSGGAVLILIALLRWSGADKHIASAAQSAVKQAATMKG